MKTHFALIVAGTLLLGGCATKKYVSQTVDPVKTKVDQVDTAQQATQKQLEGDETKLSATAEKANSADTRAGDALNRADAASQKADQVRNDLRNELSQTVANLDDYKLAGDTTVQFAFNSARLTPEDKQELDALVTGHTNALKRYFIAIEGFTDRIGTDEYNLELSRRRAQAVQYYLVSQHNIPVYRVQIVGLGKDKPVDQGRNRAALAKNRRVEVTVFSADATTGGTQKEPSATTRTPKP
jgi:OOP family OmpA-OmpF porin